MANNMFSETLRIQYWQVDMFGRLRTAELFRLMQETALSHSEQFGAGYRRLWEQGLLWIITRQWAEIFRMPLYDETITVRSWLGESQHILLPRYYECAGEDGEVLVRASALWALLDGKKRKIVRADECGLVFPVSDAPPCCEGGEHPAVLPEVQREAFSAPFSYIDRNGHMNNTRYFDLAEDRIGAAAEGKRLQSVSVSYGAEVRFRQEITVTVGHEGNVWSVLGTVPEGKKPLFRMQFTYE